MNIQRAIIERFKGIDRLDVPLSRVTVLTGPNNSGKSSVLQAIQFATSITQTAKAYSRDFLTGTLAAEQLIYSPLRDVEALAPNGSFTQSKSKAISVTLDAEIAGAVQQCAIKVSRGKNRNLSFNIVGYGLALRIAAIDAPFSVYVTGLAGIPKQEEFRSEGVVRKAASRGDANSVLRNVLFLLSRDGPAWQQFLGDLQQVFPGIGLIVRFDPAVDDFIDIRFTRGSGVELPIDAAGIGVLQTIQILSYINAYKPSLILLDEPDSHLHPTNQRRLAKVLSEIAARRDFQILLTTHSRHLLDELRSTASIMWLDKGTQISEEFDYIQALIDLGALDQIDTLSHLDAIILTEDTDTTALQSLVESTGVDARYEIHSYSGSSNITNTILLAQFIHEKAPDCRIIVHRDRDFLTDLEATELREQLNNSGILPLITTNVDLESAFISAPHICELYPEIDLHEATELIDNATTISRATSLAKMMNVRTRQEAGRVGGLGNVNNGEVARLATEEYDDNVARFRHGKTVLGNLVGLIQARIALNPTLLRPTATLSATPEAVALSDLLTHI